MKFKYLFILVLSSFMLISSAKAIDFNIEYQPNIFSYRADGEYTHSGQLGYITVDNEVAYNLDFKNKAYDNFHIDNDSLNQFTNDDLLYLKLVNYYGYSEKRNNIYYYMATQELIWRKISGDDVYWTTSGFGDERINIESYKSEILNDVNNYFILPSFSNDEITGNYGETIELVDENNVLSNYEIDYDGSNLVWKEDNKLYIKILSSELEEIKLIKSTKNDIQDKIYVSENELTKLAVLGIDDIRETTIKVNPNEYSRQIKISFKNIKNDEIISKDIYFKIKNLDDDSYYIYNGSDIFSTSNGFYISDFELKEGRYQIEFVNSSGNYFSHNIEFEINKDNYSEILSIDNYLERQRGYILINRTVNLMNSEYQVPNITYYVYAKEDIVDEDGNIIYSKDELVDVFKTNADGIAVSDYIEFGNYYIMELDNNNVPKYYKDISINFNNSNFNEIYLKRNVNIQTEYDDINILINTTNEYGIYAKEDIIFLGKILYQKDELIKKLIPNNGVIDTKINLPYGEYYLKNIQDASDYYEFSYNKNNNEISIILNNQTNKNNIKAIGQTDLINPESIIEKSLDNIVEENISNSLFNEKDLSLPNTSDKYFKYYIVAIIIIVSGFIGIFRYQKV